MKNFANAQQYQMQYKSTLVIKLQVRFKLQICIQLFGVNLWSFKNVF